MIIAITLLQTMKINVCINYSTNDGGFRDKKFG